MARSALALAAARSALPALVVPLALALGAAALAACPPATDVTPIASVQGSGARSPLAGRRVTVEGVVTASFMAKGSLGGFFLQDPAGDGDPATSDGLFVTLPGGSPAPPVGELLRVRGRVRETRSLTQLAADATPLRCGSAPLPPATPVALPLGNAGWEALEGMRVRLTRPLTITDVYDLGRYGELTLAAGRLFAPTQGTAGHGVDTLGRIVLDDGSTTRRPRPVPYTMPDGALPRDGDAVAPLTAVVSTVATNVHALEPTGPVRLLPRNPRPAAPEDVGGDLRLATLNTHNFFTTLGERGADTRQAYRSQLGRLVSALAGLDADALLLEEIESGGMASENALLAALNRRLGSEVYAAVPDPPSGVGSDRIKQAILYKPSRLELLASASDPAALFERAPIAASFRAPGGRVLTLVAVHLKSKGGCPSAGDVDRGYGCWNLRRSAQAQAVVDFAAARATAVGSPDLVIAGDLNSYAAEPPVRIVERAGYRSAGASVAAARRYSYVYRGEAGTLDDAFLSPSLAAHLAGASYWHIDADESPLVAQGGWGGVDGSGAAAAASPYRASDHDPLLLGLEMPGSAR